MYGRVLIPLDGSKEAEGVFAAIEGELTPDCEVTLLQVVPPGETVRAGEYVFLGSQQEEDDRSKAMIYLKAVIERLGGDPARWRCETTVAKSVAGGIVDVAGREGVDLIAMYTHDRKGLAKLIQRSVASAVQRRASIDVKVFKPRELAGVA